MWEIVQTVKEKKTSNFDNATSAKENLDISNVISITINKSINEWIFYLRYSYHISPHRDWFSAYQLIVGGRVLMGNSVAYKVVGIDIIQIKMHDGIVRTITNARHVPKLKKNLFSLATLDSNGYT